MKATLQDPARILVGIVIFVAFFLALYNIVGAPQCDALANQTAFALQQEISRVASPDFPIYHGSGVPLKEYATVPIRLCQQFKGILPETAGAFQTAFFGGIPQYMIYYEKFPESSWALGWNEAYPWSGGAAGNLVFYGVVRYGIPAVAKAGKYLTFGAVTIPYSIAKFTGKSIFKVKNLLSKKKATLFLTEEIDDIIKNKGLTKDTFGQIIFRSAAEKEHESLRQAGIVSGIKDGKLVLSKLTIKEESESNTLLKEVFSQLTPEEQGEVGAKTYADVFESFRNTLQKEDRALFDDVWDTKSGIGDVLGDVQQTGLYKSTYAKVAEKLDAFILSLKTAGYAAEKRQIGTPFFTRDFSRKLIASSAEDQDKLARNLLGVKDKLSIKFESLFVEDAGRYKMSNKLSAYLKEFIEKSDDGKLYRRSGFLIVPERQYSKLPDVIEGKMSMDEYFKILKGEGEESKKELIAFMGFLEQNPKAFPVEFGVGAAKAEARKLVFIDGLGLVNPEGYGPKGFVLSKATEDCQGNSICTYSHAVQQEAPRYLSKEAQEYFVRSWRPVSPIENFAGIQGLIMQVPPNPRFYVVGPCFAVAKIWKTEYDGEKTIFVKPEKCGVPASNYCYADEDLIKQYDAIWAGSDVCTIVSAWFTAGGSAVAKAVSQKDLCIIAQAAAEGAVSWPGMPWSELDVKQMQESSKCQELSEFKIEKPSTTSGTPSGVGPETKEEGAAKRNIQIIGQSCIIDDEGKRTCQ